jgi:hypothetical protein
VVVGNAEFEDASEFEAFIEPAVILTTVVSSTNDNVTVVLGELRSSELSLVAPKEALEYSRAADMSFPACELRRPDSISPKLVDNACASAYTLLGSVLTVSTLNSDRDAGREVQASVREALNTEDSLLSSDSEIESAKDANIEKLWLDTGVATVILCAVVF